ncbi:MAG: hypothetical protein AAF394_01840 [Planctomycetota bacterium]
MSEPEEHSAEPNSKLDAELRSLGSSIRASVSLREGVLHELGSEPEDAGSLDSESSIAAIQTRSPKVGSKSINLGEMSMLKKLSLGSLATSVLVVAGIFAGNLLLVKQSIADVVEQLQKVTSYQAKMRFETQIEEGKPAIEQTSTLYWKAPGAQRMDSSVRTPGRQTESSTTSIRFPDKAGIELNNGNKTYRVLPAAAGPRSPLMAMEQLASYRGEAEKNLGTKQIDGTDCYGFSVPLDEVDENLLDGTMEVWVDKTTDLPVEIHMHVFPGVDMITSDFEWNKQFDESVFEVAAPENFTAAPEPKPVPDEERAKHIAEALRLYAKHSGGIYPPVKIIYGDVISVHMHKKAGLKGPPYSKEIMKSELFQELNGSSLGFAHMTVLMRDSAEAKYFGKTVRPKDKNAVLFQWPRPDGKMQTIYGDLRIAVE